MSKKRLRSTALEGTQKVERLPILLPGIRGTKLLGVPAIPHKTAAVGSKRAKATLELVKIWDCEKNLCDMVFDTTSSNTGAQTAACVALQNVSKRLLWFACRHHIGEIILTHVWDSLHILRFLKALKFLFFKDFGNFIQQFQQYVKVSTFMRFLKLYKAEGKIPFKCVTLT